MTEPLCCSKFKTQLSRAESEVARLARICSRQHDRNGRAHQRYLDDLAQAKANVESVKQHRIDHEASHAAEVGV